MVDFTTITAIGAFVLLVHAVFAVYVYRSLSDSASEPTGESPGRPSRLSAEDSSGSSTPQDRPESTDSSAGSSVAGTVQCPVCGTPNDPQFQFCRRCVSELSANGPPQGGGEVTGT